MPGYRNAGDDGSPDAKLAVVIETASMSEAELSAYCRQKGLYSEQVQRLPSRYWSSRRARESRSETAARCP
ncbi:hypothetical protein MRBBS_3235 [Marinobacter sp. BSs20148]|nr:hypothetical protein MRBBS_3235 [Marinobacter sp. BSs20148]